MERLQGIQAARGLAALLVVFYHAGRLISLPQYVGHIPLAGAFNFGHAGVDFFFVLSGFIIVFVHQRDIGRPAALPRYLWRRITRIYPVYWALTAFVLLMALIARHDVIDVLTASNLLLLPLPGEPPVGVAWTLRHEMLFYAAFAAAVLSRPLGAALFAAWLTAVLAGTAGALPPAWDVVTSTYNLDFIIGATVALAVRRITLPAPMALAALATAGFLATGLAENAGLIATAGPASRALFGLTSGALVLALAAAERIAPWRYGRLPPALGEISYSLYLVHNIAIAYTARILMTVGLVKTIPGPAVMALGILAALIAGTLLHRLVEGPAARAQARLWRRFGNT